MRKEVLVQRETILNEIVPRENVKGGKHIKPAWGELCSKEERTSCIGCRKIYNPVNIYLGDHEDVLNAITVSLQQAGNVSQFTSAQAGRIGGAEVTLALNSEQ